MEREKQEPEHHGHEQREERGGCGQVRRQRARVPGLAEQAQEDRIDHKAHRVRTVTNQVGQRDREPVDTQVRLLENGVHQHAIHVPEHQARDVERGDRQAGDQQCSQRSEVQSDRESFPALSHEEERGDGASHEPADQESVDLEAGKQRQRQHQIGDRERDRQLADRANATVRAEQRAVGVGDVLQDDEQAHDRQADPVHGMHGVPSQGHVDAQAEPHQDSGRYHPAETGPLRRLDLRRVAGAELVSEMLVVPGKYAAVTVQPVLEDEHEVLEGDRSLRARDTWPPQSRE